mmetsp:Transcript_94427/g.244338  ORF Transcript_94427/g.244338 Transcript_94427/m.244338 type:complete len:109 (-) Transcript_94427:161-487(-)
MMGLFYSGAAICQILAGSAMLLCNQHIREYWVKQNTTANSQTNATVLGTISDRTPQGEHVAQIIVPEGAAPGTMLQVPTPDGGMLQAAVPSGAAPGTIFTVQYSDGLQ